MNTLRNPFSAGRWVSGSHFYGRKKIIANLLDSNESCDWIIGKRRVGKTSLLRQLEYRVNGQESNTFALFWDIQGSYDVEGLADSLIDAIEDSQDEYPETWEALDCEPDDSVPCHQILKRLSRSLQRKNMGLMLLIDEAEEFITVGKKNPVFLGKLRKFFQNSHHVHTVISSTPRLEQIHKEVVVDTSPFLHGFNAMYLGHFDQEAAQTCLKSGLSDEHAIAKIIDKTDGNPYELQLFAKHFFENQKLEDVTLQLEANPSLIQVIEVNFDLLSPEEQDLVKDVFCGKNHLTEFETPAEKAMVSKLLQLGFLSIESANHLRICSYFHTQWLSAKFDASPSFHAPHQSDPAVDKAHFQLVLKQILTLYKFFLEQSQDGKRCEGLAPFKLSQIDQSIYPDRGLLKLTKDAREGKPWERAILELAEYLVYFEQNESSWSLFRFFQMAESEPSTYSEADFLDLMMLISEEAALN
ncbi:AAA family ATPase [Sulfidibacter corallicola]|uniref:AAA family ATPase n=1 Tax=Sulfidibacter corallicola TaxID=2818388 RepID=A0A8A4TYG6_SULCO|nr:AAA family ATPase [Sulfidibacter corallicola]QTD54301.1 AAA family ATPase [Sulfidibacter corallicola]